MGSENKMEKIVSLAKRRGFVFQSSEIYGGAAGLWDLGPLGAELTHNIKDLWWKHFVTGRDDIFGLSSTVISPSKVWEASGHLEGFTDPMIECEKCKRRFRSDHLEDKEKCPECNGPLGAEKTFNLMFPVHLGSSADGSNVGYLRGELAQGMFVNFKNVLDTMRPRLPFGIAQIGRAFRNEIAPRDFLFRVREFEIMEFEYFVREEEWEKYFELWKEEMWQWIDMVGIDPVRVHELEVPKEDRAHYSKRTVDFEFDFPFGRKELYGLAYRTDHDLNAHMEHSGVDLRYEDPQSGEKFIPHAVEPTFGVGRTLLAILVSAYTEDELGGEKRVFLKLKPELAPIKAAVFPLLKNKPELVEKAREVYDALKKEIPQVMWDDNGNIGKRYRRQDEIGTPACITIDFDTLEDDTVTIRNRDTGEQKRIAIQDIIDHV
jgi:glycyl-tRNA synthetase